MIIVSTPAVFDSVTDGVILKNAFCSGGCQRYAPRSSMYQSTEVDLEGWDYTLHLVSSAHDAPQLAIVTK